MSYANRRKVGHAKSNMPPPPHLFPKTGHNKQLASSLQLYLNLGTTLKEKKLLPAYTKADHHQPTSETLLTWRSAGGSIIARDGMLTGRGGATPLLLEQFHMGLGARENLSSGVCEQRRRRPDCVSAQSDQRLCYSIICKICYR